MRTLALTLVAGIAALALAGTASAAPTVSFTFTSTTGTGTVGSNSIDAAVGDTIRMLITVTSDANGLSFNGVSLDWDGGDLVAAGALECPAPENAFPAFGCTVNGAAVPPFFSNALQPGVTIDNVGGGTGQFTASSIPGASGVFNLFIGEIFFTVGATATSETISTFYQPGLDSINDNVGGTFAPAASATIVVPEPGTAALMGLGLLALGAAGRRRN